MADEIRVYVLSRRGRKNLQLRYVDPITGKQVWKSAETDDPVKAERAAAKWETELATGRKKSPGRITWEEARDEYEVAHAGSLEASTQTQIKISLDHVERIIDPERLVRVSTVVMRRFRTQRLREVEPSTVAKDLRHVMGFLRWCQAADYLVELPTVHMPKKAGRQAKGRPVTTEEYERMLAKTPKVRPRDAELWQRLLRGLWLSGLRIGEACRLSWDWSAAFGVELLPAGGVFRIAGKAQKSKKTETAPMAPDFAAMLAEVPEAERIGPVFSVPVCLKEAGRVVSSIGEKAGVIVAREDEDGEEKIKYASAHDLRRSFGTRWASRVKPPVLQRLMRHATIQTTMEYYADLDAEEIASSLASEFRAGSVLGSASPKAAKSQPKAKKEKRP